MSDFSYMPYPTLTIMVTSGVFGTIFDLMVRMPRDGDSVTCKFLESRTSSSEDTGENLCFEMANWVVLPC